MWSLSNGPFDSNLSSLFDSNFRTERDGAVKETTKEPFTNSKIGSAVDRLPWRLSGMGLRKMFGKEISRWFWDLDHQENLPWKISAETLRTGLITGDEIEFTLIAGTEY